jgi:hypothetical protein
MEGKPERTLDQELRGGGGPKYAATIRVDGAKVKLEYKAEEMHVKGIIPDYGFEQSGTIAAESADAARAIADRVCQALGAIGFVAGDLPKEPKAKAKASGKASAKTKPSAKKGKPSAKKAKKR